MRDPNRIDVFCDELATIWKDKVPDWRFGQLMFNFFSEIKTDPFFWEEERFMEELKKYLKVEN